MLERQRQRMDETILRRMEEIEQGRKQVETARAAVEEAEKALQIVTSRYEKAHARIEEQMGTLAPERERLAAALEPATLRRYDEIRHRSHNLAAVRIENGACGGCRMKVGSAVLRRMISSESYVYCESCTRFLRLRDPCHGVVVSQAQETHTTRSGLRYQRCW